jgi:hypothetical protein
MYQELYSGSLRNRENVKAGKKSKERMMARWKGWEHVKIDPNTGSLIDPYINPDHQGIDAIAPVIVSASRSTDIPAFYGDWLLDRVRKGYAAWANPFSGQIQAVSFQRTRIFALWSKNPRPFFPVLEELSQGGYGLLFLFTVNDYEDNGLEPAVPPLDERIRTFYKLSSRLGSGKLTWRYDPILLSEDITAERILEKIQGIGDRIHTRTRRLVISFIDIDRYPRVKRNLAAAGLSGVREASREEIRVIAEGLAELNEGWGLEVQVCGEETDLSSWGIPRAACISYDILIREFPDDRFLIDFLAPGEDPAQRRKELKDPGQRKRCGCVVSKDIGHYSTCINHCRYCYANSSQSLVEKNYQRYCSNREKGIFPPAMVE